MNPIITTQITKTKNSQLGFGISYGSIALSRLPIKLRVWIWMVCNTSILGKKMIDRPMIHFSAGHFSSYINFEFDSQLVQG